MQCKEHIEQELPRRVLLFASIDQETAGGVASSILTFEMEDHNTPILFYINSEGGGVYDTLALYDIMRLIKAPISTFGIGKVMSAALLLLAAGNPGQRYASKYTTFLLHDVSSYLAGDKFSLATEIEEIKRISNLLISALAENSKLTEQKIRALIKDKRDFYFDANDAIKFGFIDGVF